MLVDPKFYENDYMTTTEYDLEYVRSPFYDIAKSHLMSNEDRAKIFEEIAVKQTYLRSSESLIEPPPPTKESIAYTRYGDYKPDREAVDMNSKFLFEFPRGKPYSIINSGELFRVQKPADHFD